MVVQKIVTLLYAARIVIQRKVEKMATVTVFVLTNLLAWRIRKKISARTMVTHANGDIVTDATIAVVGASVMDLDMDFLRNGVIPWNLDLGTLENARKMKIV